MALAWLYDDYKSVVATFLLPNCLLGALQQGTNSLEPFQGLNKKQKPFKEIWQASFKGRVIEILSFKQKNLNNRM